MRRWLPYVLVVLGIAGVVSGWLLYPKGDATGQTCSVQVLYRNYIQGSGEIGNSNGPCADGTFELYASLALLVAGTLLFLGGWAWAAPRHAPRITTRIPARVVAWSLLVGLILVGTGGWFGWRTYDRHQETQGFHHAQAALGRLTLPAGITAGKQQFCLPNREQICAHTLLPMKQLEAELVTLLHGHRQQYFCAKGWRPVACVFTVRGELAGYPVFASVSPATYQQGKPHPQGAQPVKSGNRPTRMWVYGSQVVIGVASPEDMRA